MMNAVHILLRAARAGSADLLKQELQRLQPPESLQSVAEQSTGLTPLHLAAAGGYEECVEALLEAQADPLAVCSAQRRTPLHCAAQSAIPMCAYQLASRAPAACLERDVQERTPIDLAAASEKGEVLNAMLLACSGHASGEALASVRALLAAGAVCDTWAPNGSSALMLAASADCAEGVGLLLDNAASLELQDALGRTALHFAAGNNARHALEALLDRGASVSIRDRRGRNVLDYAAQGSEVRQVLEARIAEMESKAARLQEELLAELLENEAPAQQAKERAGSKKSKKKKGGKQGKAKPATAAAVATVGGAPAPAVAQPPAPEAPAPASAEQEQPENELLRQQEQQQQAVVAASPAPPAGAGAVATDVAAGAADVEGPSDDEHLDSSEWQVVGRRKREDNAHHHHHHLSQRHLDNGSGGELRRCPSASSLGSSCSGESHDTAGSSQRSVLIPPSRSSSAARGHLAGKHVLRPLAQPAPAPVTAAGHAKPAWGKPAAPQAATPVKQQPQDHQALAVVHSIDEAAFPPLAVAAQQEQQQERHPFVGAQQLLRAGSDAGGSSSAAEAAPQPGAAASRAAAADAPLPVPPSAAELATDLPGMASTQNQQRPLQQQQHDASALTAEVAMLRAEVARLRLLQQQAEVRHQEELASVLEDTAAHEAAAVAQAVAAERLHCIYRFAAFLQNNHLAADLLASHGLAASAHSFPSMAGLAAAGAGLSGPAAGSLEFLGLGFPPLDARRSAAGPKLTAPPGAAATAGPLPGATGNPLTSAPFCFADLEHHLRTEYSGDVSRFVVPASEAEACPPLPLPVMHF